MRCLALALLASCSTPFAPAPGEWEVTSTTARSDGCDLLGSGASFSLELGGPGAFDLHDVAGRSLACALDGQEFSCGPTAVREPIDGMDAEVTGELAGEGAFTDGEHLSADLRVSFACAGEDCAAFAAWGPELPCTSEFTMLAAAASGS